MYKKVQWRRCKRHNEDIKLHMLKVKINCKKVLDDTKFPFCSKHDQTTEYVMEYGREKSKKQYQITEKIATERKVKV